MKKIKDTLFIIAVVAVIAIGFLWSHLFGMEHIEDTNGPDDFSLAVITEADIAGKGVKECVGGPNTSRSKLNIMGVTVSDGTRYYSKQFSGIHMLDSWNLIMDCDLVFNLYEYEVTGGNFLMCVVHDGQIIATVEPAEDGTVTFLMEDVEKGLYELYIAGESAAFSFVSVDLGDDV